MDDAEKAVDEACDVYALLTARINNDQDSFESILFGGNKEPTEEDSHKTMMLIVSTVDLCIATLRMAAMEKGISVSTLIRSMAMITRMVGPELIEKRERGY